MHSPLSHSHPPQRHRAVAALVLAGALVISCLLAVVVSTAQGPPQTPATEEREIRDEIPKHLPIKVKVKNVEKVKDLENDEWVRDLEIEIENRSDKPIYYLRMLVELPDVTGDAGHPVAFPLRYGRPDLINFGVPLERDDVPLNPGETYTFRIPETLQRGWKALVKKRGTTRNTPKKIQFIFVTLNFGDGTGFRFTTGEPFDIRQKRAGISASSTPLAGRSRRPTALQSQS